MINHWMESEDCWFGFDTGGVDCVDLETLLFLDQKCFSQRAKIYAKNLAFKAEKVGHQPTQSLFTTGYFNINTKPDGINFKSGRYQETYGCYP